MEYHKCKRYSYLFNGCHSLISFPDLLKWNTSKVMLKSDSFNDCFNILNFYSKLMK